MSNLRDLRAQQSFARTRQDQNHNLTPGEQRFYAMTPRFEDQVKRTCARSVVMFRSDIAEGLARGLEDLEREYLAARSEASGAGRLIADLEARFGATIVLVHLQIIAKVNELFELAETGTPVADIRRLGENLSATAYKLADIEARSSIATTGDLNEEERNKIRFYKTERFVHIAEAVQLRREAQAATKRLAEGLRDEAEAKKKGADEVASQAKALQERALVRADEIQRAGDKIRAEADVQREPTLDQLLKQVATIVKELRRKYESKAA